jgi:hypothetical protein
VLKALISRARVLRSVSPVATCTLGSVGFGASASVPCSSPFLTRILPVCGWW